MHTLSCKLYIMCYRNPVYMAPEVFLHDCDLLTTDGVAKRRTLSSSDDTELLNPPSAPNVDSWSFGVMLLQYLAVSNCC